MPRNSVKVDGSRSTDDHGITSYLWEKVSPVSVNVVMTGSDTSILSLYDLVEGKYVFRLIVSDKAGQQDQDTVTVTVDPGTYLNYIVLPTYLITALNFFSYPHTFYVTIYILIN